MSNTCKRFQQVIHTEDVPVQDGPKFLLIHKGEKTQGKSEFLFSILNIPVVVSGLPRAFKAYCQENIKKNVYSIAYCLIQEKQS